MRSIRNLVGIAIYCLALISTASAETVLSSLEEIGRFGADRSLQVLQSEISLREAQNERIPLILRSFMGEIRAR